MRLSRNQVLICSMLVVMVLSAPCCGDPCSRSLLFNKPVSDMSLAPGEVGSYELFKNVWTVSSYCDGGYTAEWFPPVEIMVNNPAIATARLDSSLTPEARQSSNPFSWLRVEALAPGQTQVVLRTRTEMNCEQVLDATHFTVTVSANAPSAP